MNTTTTHLRPIRWPFLFGFAVLVCLFLFYIDEGRYTLEGLQQPGNIFAMSLYLAGLLVGLFGMNALFARQRPGSGRTALVLGLGTIAGVALTILFLYVMAGFRLPTEP